MRQVSKCLGATGAAALAIFAALSPIGTAVAQAFPTLRAEQTITRIAFGSCAHQDLPQPIWLSVLAAEPDLFIFLGDNIYADSEDEAVFRARYNKLAGKPGYQALRSSVPILATWDDHDYGANDAGADFAAKQVSRTAFLDFFGEPPDSPRRSQAGGIYAAHSLGPSGQRVQIILLDLRYGRSAQLRLGDDERLARRALRMGPYQPDDDPAQSLLSEEQWRWLEARLREPAELRVIASSTPFGSSFTGFETWANYPRERQRMLDLITTTKAAGVVFISGDIHRAEVSRLDSGAPYPLWDVTSSGLNQVWRNVAPNRNRVRPTYTRHNFGLIEIDWSGADPQVSLEIRNRDNLAVLRDAVPLSDLAPR